MGLDGVGDAGLGGVKLASHQSAADKRDRLDMRAGAWGSPEAMLGLPPDRLISWARTILAGFALAAIYLDPSQPASNAPMTYVMMLIYVLYSGALALFPPRRVGAYGAILVHAVDIGTFALLMQLTEGPTSPFFVFFTFALLSATLQWNSKGAIWTAVSLIVLLLLLNWTAPVQPDAEELNRLIMRAAYLLVAGAMLAYFGAFRERDRRRLAKLAAWPQELEAASNRPVLDRSLAHAADVIGAKRILAAWEEAEEPFWYFSYWDGQRCEADRVAWSDFGQLVPGELADAPFMRGRAGTAAGTARKPRSQEAVSPALLERFGIEEFATAPFKSTRYNGHVFVLEPASLSPGLLALTAIVASRIAAELEHYALRSEMASAVLTRERVRIARDMHDGLLQDLTAAQLRVRGAARSDHRMGEELTAVKDILSRQQKRIRAFVEEVNPRPAPKASIDLAGLVTNFSAALGEQWQRQVRSDVEFGNLSVPESFGNQLCLILAEAVANAVRHGGASEVDIEMRLDGDRLRARVRDNGAGMASLRGRNDHAALVASGRGPESLVRRIAELGGQLQLESSPQGVQLEFFVPLP